MIKEKFLTELKKIKDAKSTYIFVSNPSDYISVCSSVAHYFTSKLKLRGLYVSLGNSSKIMSSDFSKKGVNVKDLFFIDSIGRGMEKDEDSFHISNNQSLTELSLAITSVMKENNFDFFIFDSISTLLMYNDITVVERFMHFMITKLKNIGIVTVILSVDEEKSNKLIAVLSQFCDKVVMV